MLKKKTFSAPDSNVVVCGRVGMTWTAACVRGPAWVSDRDRDIRRHSVGRPLRSHDDAVQLWVVARVAGECAVVELSDVDDGPVPGGAP